MIKYIKFPLVILLVFLLFTVKGQQNISSTESLAAELVPQNGLNKLPPESGAIMPNGQAKFNIDERFYYQIRNDFTSSPEEVLSLRCYIKKIEFIIRFQGNIYGPFYLENIPQQMAGARYPLSIKYLIIQNVKGEVFDKLNSSNFSDLLVSLRFEWLTKDEIKKDVSMEDCTNLFLSSTESKRRVDKFNLSLKSFDSGSIPPGSAITAAAVTNATVATNAVVNNPIYMEHLVAELVPQKGLKRLPIESGALKSGGKGEFDIDEIFYYQIRNDVTSNPEQVLSLRCYIKRIEYLVRFKESVYGPFYLENIPTQVTVGGGRYPTSARALLQQNVKGEVLDKLNSRNILDLQIIFRTIWYTREELNNDPSKQNCSDLFPTKLNEKTRIDMFTIDVKDFGLIALVDVSPLAKDEAQLSLDVVSGITKNLARTSVDYVAVADKNSISNAMVSVPFLKYEGRQWFYKNFEVETLLVTDGDSKSKPVDFGVGIGALGTKDKTLKAGVVWRDKKPNYILGLSVRGLATWLSNYK